jgi:hypothetical protein
MEGRDVMNIIRFNDPFETAMKAWNLPEEPLPFREWQQSPLFEYTSTREKEQDHIREVVSGNTRLEACAWPFEIFRVAETQTSKGWVENGKTVGTGRYRCDMIVMRKDERVYFMGNAIQLYDESPAALAFARRYNPLIIFMSDAFTSADNPIEYKYQMAMFASGRWLHQSSASRSLAMGMMDSLAGFIVDAMIPLNHIAVVKPDEPHRSVEWIRARTHYTLITHGHPANRKEILEGASVPRDAEGELKRAAGARRAHFKQLRHPRYRFALNEQRFPGMPKGTIRVKATWVGPKEWREEGSKQIYRILEPVPERELEAPQGVFPVYHGTADSTGRGQP